MALAAQQRLGTDNPHSASGARRSEVADAPGSRGAAGAGGPSWHLFQLGFVLLNIAGVADGQHTDRKTVELIFFP